MCGNVVKWGKMNREEMNHETSENPTPLPAVRVIGSAHTQDWDTLVPALWVSRHVSRVRREIKGREMDAIKEVYHLDLGEHGAVLCVELHHEAFWSTTHGEIEEVSLFNLTLDDCCRLIEGLARYKTALMDRQEVQTKWAQEEVEEILRGEQEREKGQ